MVCCMLVAVMAVTAMVVKTFRLSSFTKRINILTTAANRAISNGWEIGKVEGIANEDNKTEETRDGAHIGGGAGESHGSTRI